MATEQKSVKDFSTQELQAMAFVERENIDFRTQNLNAIRQELVLREQAAQTMKPLAELDPSLMGAIETEEEPTG
jgi:hypothetical protein